MRNRVLRRATNTSAARQATLSLTSTHAVQSALRARLTSTRILIRPASLVPLGGLLLSRVRSLVLSARRAAPTKTKIRRRSAQPVHRASTLAPVPTSATRAALGTTTTISTLRRAVFLAYQARALAAALQSASTARLDSQISTPTLRLPVSTAALKLGIGWPASEPRAAGNASLGTLTPMATRIRRVSFAQ